METNKIWNIDDEDIKTIMYDLIDAGYDINIEKGFIDSERINSNNDKILLFDNIEFRNDIIVYPSYKIELCFIKKQKTSNHNIKNIFISSIKDIKSNPYFNIDYIELYKNYYNKYKKIDYRDIVFLKNDNRIYYKYYNDTYMNIDKLIILLIEKNKVKLDIKNVLDVFNIKYDNVYNKKYPLQYITAPEAALLMFSYIDDFCLEILEMNDKTINILHNNIYDELMSEYQNYYLEEIIDAIDTNTLKKIIYDTIINEDDITNGIIEKMKHEYDLEFENINDVIDFLSKNHDILMNVMDILYESSIFYDIVDYSVHLITQKNINKYIEYLYDAIEERMDKYINYYYMVLDKKEIPSKKYKNNNKNIRWYAISIDLDFLGEYVDYHKLKHDCFDIYSIYYESKDNYNNYKKLNDDDFCLDIYIDNNIKKEIIEYIKQKI